MNSIEEQWAAAKATVEHLKHNLSTELAVLDKVRDELSQAEKALEVAKMKYDRRIQIVTHLENKTTSAQKDLDRLEEIFAKKYNIKTPISPINQVVCELKDCY